MTWWIAMPKQITDRQAAAAIELGVSLAFADTPLAIARLTELVRELQLRIDALEHQSTAQEFEARHTGGMFRKKA
jgi:hypothetical protein